jgi:tetratricopeptide (TPR) repeat protein
MKAKGNLDDAIAADRAAIRLRPDLALAHYNLGTVLILQEKIEEAVAEFRRAIELKPDHALAHFDLGNAMKAQGRLEEAVAEFHKARDYAPNDTELAQLIERSLTATDQ